MQLLIHDLACTKRKLHFLFYEKFHETFNLIFTCILNKICTFYMYVLTDVNLINVIRKI
jgi:hypothetical protein